MDSYNFPEDDEIISNESLSSHMLENNYFDENIGSIMNENIGAEVVQQQQP